MLDEEFAAREEVACRLVEHEAERAHINKEACTLSCIEELDIAVLEEPELQSLSRVVHLGGHDGIRQVDFIGESLIDIEQRGSFQEALGDVDVLAANLKHGKNGLDDVLLG